MTNVEIVKQASWGGTRDNLVRGGAAGGNVLESAVNLTLTGSFGTAKSS